MLCNDINFNPRMTFREFRKWDNHDIFRRRALKFMKYLLLCLTGSKIKKFTQRSRLFVGNMPPDVTEDEFKTLFKKYGEISETFVHASKGFGFVRLVSHDSLPSLS